MSSPPNRHWLAREGHVHGPYDLHQLLAMDAQAELLATDSFCQEGEQTWIPYEAWRAGLTAPNVKPKQTVIRAKPSGPGVSPVQKSGTFAPPVHLVSLPKTAKAPGNGRTPDTASGTQDTEDPVRRVNRLVEAFNDHRRAHPHRHPFYFAEPQLIAETISWLDTQHQGWDSQRKSHLDRDCLHHWLIPAMATVKPDLVKPSHRSDFGEGRPWRTLA